MQEYSLPVRPHELLSLAKARVSFCGFLNIHFITLPDKDFVGRVRKDPFSRILSDLTQDECIEQDIAEGASLMRGYIDATRDLDIADLAERLGVDRTRLYRGVSPNYGPAPPYESLWGDAPQGIETLQYLAQTYRLGGFTLKEDTRERLDYIGLELDYMAHLARKEVSALEAQDADVARGAQELQEVFVQEHLGRWVPLYVAKALDYAETDFYRGHLHMLNGFVVGQKKALKQLTKI